MDKTDENVYFPITNENAMMSFLKKDEEFNQRKKNFLSLLYSTTSKKEMTYKQFAEKLVTTIFTRAYLEQNRWPTIW